MAAGMRISLKGIFFNHAIRMPARKAYNILFIKILLQKVLCQFSIVFSCVEIKTSSSNEEKTT